MSTTATEYPYDDNHAMFMNNVVGIKAAAIPIADGLAGALTWFFFFPTGIYYRVQEVILDLIYKSRGVWDCIAESLPTSLMHSWSVGDDS